MIRKPTPENPPKTGEWALPHSILKDGVVMAPRLIRWQLCDWTRFEPNRFSLVPHTSITRARSSGEYAGSVATSFEVALSNLEVAMDQVRILRNLRREALRQAEKKT